MNLESEYLICPDKSASRNESPQVLLHAGNSDPVPKLAREPMHHREIHLGSIRLKSETQSEPSLSPYSLWRTTQGPKARNITAQPEGLGSRAERNGRAEGPKHPAPNRCAGLCSERRTTQLSCRHNPRSCTFVQLQHEREFRIAVPTIELRHSERSEEPLDLYFAPARLSAHPPCIRSKPSNSYPFNNL